MKCVICHSENIENINVKEEVHLENDIVYIPIKVPTCNNCNERYYDKKTIRYLEKLEQELKTKNTGLKEIGKVLEYTC